MPESTIQDVLEAVQGLSTHMDEQFVAVDQRFNTVDHRFKDIDKQFADVRSETSIMQFGLKSEMAEIKSKMVTKQDLADLEQRILTEIDRFVVLHQTLDVELVALRSRCERMESFMTQVAKKLNLEFQPT